MRAVGLVALLALGCGQPDLEGTTGAPSSDGASGEWPGDDRHDVYPELVPAFGFDGAASP